MELSAAIAATDPEHLLELALEIQSIPAPTFAESRRAEHVRNLFAQASEASGGFRVELLESELGVPSSASGSIKNVLVTVPGAATTAPLVVSAHTDTVFGEQTDLASRRDTRSGRAYGPGLGDNSVAVAALVVVLEAVATTGWQPEVPLVLAANAAEEGLGDLLGIRSLLPELERRYGAKPAGAIVLEGLALGNIYNAGIGVKRYRLDVTTAGGHSWADHGQASAVHELIRALGVLAGLEPPANPRTTFNIGTIRGGTSINTIAAAASAEIDLRCETEAGLEAFDREVREALGFAAGERRRTERASYRLTQIGRRPAGSIPVDHWLVESATSALARVGLEPQIRAGSTDVNAFLAAGVPAVCVGVTNGANAHRLDEYIETDPLGIGLRQIAYLLESASTQAAEIE